MAMDDEIMNAMISDLRNDDSAAVKRSDPVAVAMTMATTTTTRTMTMTTTMTMAMTMATAPMKTMTMTMTTKMTIAFSQVLLDYADCGHHAEKMICQGVRMGVSYDAQEAILINGNAIIGHTYH